MAQPTNDRPNPDKLTSQRVLDRLAPSAQELLRDRVERYHFTFQELRLLTEAAADLLMWGETPLEIWWVRKENELAGQGQVSKARLLDELRIWLDSLRRSAKSYPPGRLPNPKGETLTVVGQTSAKKILGMCPVASEDTVCCNLRTIDAVEGCGFGCNYCTIQTFYGGRIVIEASLAQKLRGLSLDPDRFYHLGTGQSSDSLMWGNQNGVLDALADFARNHPRVLLELKTKSKNVAYFLDHETPRNLVLSWSLNTPTLIDNEEHLTASLDDRLGSARRVADLGIAVGFHFHPMVFYDHWRRDYREVAQRLMKAFAPEDVAFVSFGSVTFIKPVIHAIRKRGRPTKMLQMELVRGPKGKLSYPDPLKQDMFRHIHETLAPWHGRVFTYLCMEKAEIWLSTFGYVYGTNEEFEQDFGRKVLGKLFRATP